MVENYKTVFASIHDTRRTPCGAGYLFDSGYLITCAHVINTAIGRDAEDASYPLCISEIEFKLSLFQSHQDTYFSAYLHTWGPEEDNFSAMHDYAILEVNHDKLTGYRQGDYNLPEACDKKRTVSFYKTVSGLWFQGHTFYKYNSDGLIQVYSDNRNFTLELGDSGAPIYDTKFKKIIGIVQAKPPNQSSIGHMLPVARIIEEWKKNNEPNDSNTISGIQIPNIKNLIPINWDDVNGYVVDSYAGENPRLLRYSVLFAKAHHCYSEAKKFANEGEWSNSIKNYLIAYSIFELMGVTENKEYKFRAARVAGRLAWGFIVEHRFSVAKNYLNESEKLDEVEAAGNYFMAMQYSFRSGAPFEETLELAEKFIEKCTTLNLLPTSNCANIDNLYVFNLVKAYFNYITNEYHKIEPHYEKKFSKSDYARLLVVKAQAARKKNIANKYFLKAIDAFENNGLPQYASLCRLERLILEYSGIKNYDQKKKVLEAIKVCIPQVNMGIDWQNSKLERMKYIIDMNISFLKICKKSTLDKIDYKTLIDILPKVIIIAKQEHLDEKKLLSINKLYEKILRLEKNPIKGSTIINIHNLFYEIYKSVPLLFGNYVDILKEVLSDRFKKTKDVKKLAE